MMQFNGGDRDLCGGELRLAPSISIATREVG
jgi:hypothetical protein